MTPERDLTSRQFALSETSNEKSPKVIILRRSGEVPMDITRIAHVGPFWKPTLELNTYAGTERMVREVIDEFGQTHMAIGEQIVNGHPANGPLESEVSNVKVYYPATDGFHDGDLYKILQEEPKTAADLEKEAAEFAYQTVIPSYTSQNAEITIIQDHTGRRKVGVDFATATGLPVVFTVHGPVSPPDNKSIVDLNDLAYCKTADPRLVSLVAISRDQMEHDVSLPWRAQIHNGVNLEKLPFKPEKDPQNRDLVYLGRICEDKGFHTAVKIRQELAKRGIKMRLVVGGSIEGTEASKKFWTEQVVPLLANENVKSLEKFDNRDKMQHLTDTDIRDADIVFLGDVGKEAKQDLLTKSRTVLFPIQWAEPFGLVPIEAAACGTPSVAFKNGAVNETLIDGVTGAVISTQDIDEMNIDPDKRDQIKIAKSADAVEEILQGKRFDPYKAREHVAVNFSHTVMTASYRLLLEDSIARARGEKRPSGVMTFRKNRLPSGHIAIQTVYQDRPAELNI